ncbi:MAG: hypothetical protein JNM47_12545 [Hyphomonadaceae bacterium]|nr:hypothetical protein [Hyphomonadaceae bacterium]
MEAPKNPGVKDRAFWPALRRRASDCASLRAWAWSVTMRPILAPMAALMLLAACASSNPAPISTGASARAPARTTTAPRLDAANALARAGAADAITTAQARALFGEPDVERRDGIGALMVWTTPGCALALGFAHDRLTTVEPGPRRTGDRAPGLTECLAEMRARSAQS